MKCRAVFLFFIVIIIIILSASMSVQATEAAASAKKRKPSSALRKGRRMLIDPSDAARMIPDVKRRIYQKQEPDSSAVNAAAGTGTQKQDAFNLKPTVSMKKKTAAISFHEDYSVPKTHPPKNN